MPNILDYYEYSKLASAAYVLLDGKPLDGTAVAGEANAQERLPSKLADQVFRQTSTNPNPWTIPPGGYHGNDAEGFAATLFQRTDANGVTEKVLAIRGTEPSLSLSGDLLKADLGEIGFLGLAMGQTVSMMNYILQMQADTTNYQVKQYVLEFSTTQPANGYGIPLQASPTDPIKGYLYLAESVTTVNGLGLIAPGEKITVTGHSLGGHLAAMAARLFPDLVSDAYTYNAPGFDPTTADYAALLAGQWKKSLGLALGAVGNVALQLTDEFVSLAGNYLSSAPASGFNNAVIHTLESEDIDGFPDVNIVPSVITGAQAFGAETMIATERNSHMIEPLMDSLALQALIYRMNDTLVASGNVKRLFENVSNSIPDTMETLVEDLYKLFQGSAVDLINVDVKYDNASGLIGIGTGNIDGRRDFYDKLLVLENTIKANPALHLEMVDGATILGQAKASTADAIAYRYALVNGNPFVITGADYGIHNANGELDLYDPATNTGSLTSEYLADRAAYLTWKMKYDSGQHDDNDVVTTLGDKSYTEQWDSNATQGNWDYVDHTLRPDGNPLTLAIDGSGLSLYDHQIVFGSQAADTAEGSGDTDRLYGMDGDDTLNGNGGADKLYGGRGDDTLNGGDGSDTYVYKTGDGSDTITDTDGKGRIQYDGTGLSGGIGGDTEGSVKKATAGGTFKSSDDKYTYTWGGEGSDLTVNGNITVKNFHNGDLGITLYTRQKNPPAPIPDSVADATNRARTAVQRFGDPLTLDLNGNGIETVPLKRPPLLFDINANGIKISTGWIAPSDGLLVLDRNGNGVVDSGAELFGDRTPAYGSAGTTADGFAALAQEDSNQDGMVNAQDANWANLRVWQDLNQDGLSQPDELTTLESQGIASFNTARTAHSQMLPSGNQMADLGTFTRTDGSTGATGAPQGMADINLALDTFHRTFVDSIPLTVEAQALPDMQGSGKVRDMREAASLQTAAGQAFATALANFSAATTREDQLAQLDNLISAWADTSGFGTLQERAAAHGYTFTIALNADWQRKLTALEAFNGQGYFRMPWEGASFGGSALQGLTVGYGGNPKAMLGQFWGAQLNPLGQAYDALRDSIYQALLPQTRLKPYLDAVRYSVDASGLQVDFSAVQTAFANTLATNPDKALGDLLEFNRYGKTLFAGTSWETQGWEELGAMLNSVTITPAIQKTLSDFNIGLDGHPELAVSTGKAQLLVAADAGSTLSGAGYDDVLVGRAGEVRWRWSGVAANDASFMQMERRAA